MDPQKFIDIIKTIASAHKQVKSVFDGEDTDFAETMLSTIEYPSVWIEDPDLGGNADDDNLEIIFKGTFTVMSNPPRDDRADRVTAYKRCFTIARQIVNKLSAIQYLTEDFEFNAGKVKYSRVVSLFSDDVQGWQVEFEIKHHPGSCDDEDAFEDLENDEQPWL